MIKLSLNEMLSEGSDSTTLNCIDASPTVRAVRVRKYLIQTRADRGHSGSSFPLSAGKTEVNDMKAFRETALI